MRTQRRNSLSVIRRIAATNVRGPGDSNVLRLLVVIDGSEASTRVLNYIGRLLSQRDHRMAIHLRVHCLPSPSRVA